MTSIQSIRPEDDVCGKWPGLWSRGDLMDSLICCKMFPERHYMDEAIIAHVLGISYKGCRGMTAKDVAELYDFFLANLDLHSNPVRYWQTILDRKMRNPDDRKLVDLAILRFGRRSRPSKL